jgi:hypothetical protein
MPRFAALAALALLSAPAIAHAAPDGVEDRYGPPTTAPFAEPGQPAAMPLLAWPGKAATVARAPSTPAPYAPARPAASLPTSLYSPAPRFTAPASSVRAAWAAATGYAAPAPAPAAAPTIAPPPSPLMAASPPAAQAAPPDGQPPRLYSLHREFGLTPDPTPPLPVQFFAGNQDLADPPPPPPPHVLPAGQAAMAASARAQADLQDPDAAPASSPN